jgi:hypothetical protein
MPEIIESSESASEEEANLQSMAKANVIDSRRSPEITRERLERYQTEIHEIMQEVEQEGGMKKAGLKIARLAYNLARIPGFALAIADTACFAWAAGMAGDFDAHSGNDEFGFLTPGLKAADEAIKEALNDPQQRYEATLKSHLDGYGEKLKEQNRTFLTRDVAEGLNQ